MKSIIAYVQNPYQIFEVMRTRSLTNWMPDSSIYQYGR